MARTHNLTDQELTLEILEAPKHIREYEYTNSPYGYVPVNDNREWIRIGVAAVVGITIVATLLALLNSAF